MLDVGSVGVNFVFYKLELVDVMDAGRYGCYKGGIHVWPVRGGQIGGGTTLIDIDNDNFPDDQDCDPNDPNIYPGAQEICNDKDDNCNNQVDETFADKGDICYGCNAIGNMVCSEDGSGTICNAGSQPSPEVCDGVVDNGLPISTYYRDADGDGYGDPNQPINVCATQTGYVDNNTDCNDTNNSIKPGATEIPFDGIDQNCDGKDVTEFWAEIQNNENINDPKGALRLMKTCGIPDNKSQDDTLKILPNGWAVYVLGSTTDETCNDINKDNFRWYKIKDATDETVGWMPGAKLENSQVTTEYLSYNPNNQQELEQKTTNQLTTKEDRATKIVEAVNAYYNNTNTNDSLYSSDDGINCLSMFKFKGFTFVRDLKPGDKNCDVMYLQIILRNEGSDIYPQGLITGNFGTFTEAAVKKFQEKYGISVTGIVDLYTREKLNTILINWPAEWNFPIELILAIAAQESGRSSFNFNNELMSYDYGHGVMQVTFRPVKSDINYLQIVLNNDIETQVATSVPGSPGNESDYFGDSTEKAVEKFQKKYDLPEYSYMGYCKNPPEYTYCRRGKVYFPTREKLNEIMNNNRTAFTEKGIPPNFKFEDFLFKGMRDREDKDKFDNRGIGSKLKIPPCGNITSADDINHYKKCYKHYTNSEYEYFEYKEHEPHEGYNNQIFKYYTNTSQGFYANLKDGLRILQSNYVSSLNANANANSTDIIQWAGAVWRYNGDKPDKAGDDYLARVAEKLESDSQTYEIIEEYFSTYKNQIKNELLLNGTKRQELVNKFKNYITGEIKSPGEIQVYDSHGRITGLINGVGPAPVIIYTLSEIAG